jgi:hypothetical protein
MYMRSGAIKRGLIWGRLADTAHPTATTELSGFFFSHRLHSRGFTTLIVLRIDSASTQGAEPKGGASAALPAWSSTMAPATWTAAIMTMIQPTDVFGSPNRAASHCRCPAINGRWRRSWTGPLIICPCFTWRRATDGPQRAATSDISPESNFASLSSALYWIRRRTPPRDKIEPCY